MKNCILLTFLQAILALTVSASGFDIKTSSIIDQHGMELLGSYNDAWYILGFETPGNLNKPPRFKITKYSDGFHAAKNSILYPSFGEMTVYLKGVIMNNKISLFYARCDRRVEENDLITTIEGHRQMSSIMRQDYDLVSLEPIGKPVVVFDEKDDRFSASGILIAESTDCGKIVILVKPYYRQTNYKIILTDNKTGELYSRLFNFKTYKSYLRFQKVFVSNNGRVLIEIQDRDDIITLAAVSKIKAPHFYFFSLGQKDNEPKIIDLNPSEMANRQMEEPVVSILNNGQILIARLYFQSDKTDVAKGVVILRYDEQLNLVNQRDLIPDQKVLTETAIYNAKRSNGLPFFSICQLLPMHGGDFAMIAQYCHNPCAEVCGENVVAESNYTLVYTFDDKTEIKDVRFIPKKQSSPTIGYAFSVQAVLKGDDILLFHNEDWEADGEHGITFQCTRLPIKGEPETTKIVHTSNDFFTSMEHVYYGRSGTVLFTVERIVDFASVSREVKLMEVTMK